jgi:hypothetical protein
MAAFCSDAFAAVRTAEKRGGRCDDHRPLVMATQRDV